MAVAALRRQGTRPGRGEGPGNAARSPPPCQPLPAAVHGAERGPERAARHERTGGRERAGGGRWGASGECPGPVLLRSCSMLTDHSRPQRCGVHEGPGLVQATVSFQDNKAE